MIYNLFQAQSDLMQPLKLMAGMGEAMASRVGPLFDSPSYIRRFGALCSMVSQSGTTHERPAYGIVASKMGNQIVKVTEEAVDRTPFGTLIRFRKDSEVQQPKVLIVAPMSGHFATLLRGTVATMLPDHDVHITDWTNARDVPIAAGRFGFDDFVAHIIRFLEKLGPGSHVVAVCQPAVAVLAAVAAMAQSGNPAQPGSMTLMAGPVDTRVNPTRVNVLANEHPIGWFEQNLISTVPWRYAGAFRRVYPGFMQLVSFMYMNLDRHVDAHLRHFQNLVKGDQEGTASHRRFYDEYMAVMDLPAEFYLETVRKVFQDHDLALGRLVWRGEKIRPSAIRRTMILTVEGENDDICAIGQTVAALDLCTGLHPSMKRHHLQTGVGHYGVFNGRRWATQIYPRVREMIHSAH